MTMKAQPEGLHRKRRGEVQNNPETGKPLPADEYDVLVKDGTVIGRTKRHYKQGWFALANNGKSLKVTDAGLPDPFKTHGDAMAAIGAEYAEAALTPAPAEPPVPEPPVRSEDTKFVETEQVVVIEVSPSDIVTPEQDYPQESSVADPVGTMPGEEFLDSLPVPDEPAAAGSGDTAPSSAEDEWEYPQPEGEQPPPFFDDPFAAVE